MKQEKAKKTKKIYTGMTMTKQHSQELQHMATSLLTDNKQLLQQLQQRVQSPSQRDQQLKTIEYNDMNATKQKKYRPGNILGASFQTHKQGHNQTIKAPFKSP